MVNQYRTSLDEALAGNYRGYAERVTLMCARGLHCVAVTKQLLKLAQNRQKSANSKKLKTSLSYGWQRDLVEFSTR
jgi:hypothetical protein